MVGRLDIGGERGGRGISIWHWILRFGGGVPPPFLNGVPTYYFPFVPAPQTTHTLQARFGQPCFGTYVARSSPRRGTWWMPFFYVVLGGAPATDPVLGLRDYNLGVEGIGVPDTPGGGYSFQSLTTSHR